MVTLAVPERLELVKRSIDDFCRQTVANKNLVWVINGGVESVRKAMGAYGESLGREDIQIFTPPGITNLGQARNFSLQVATGDVLCQWDDDDCHHPERLERQMELLLEGNFEAVYLQDLIHYFPADNLLYWTNWRATEVASFPGSLMVRREVPIRYPVHGQVAHLGEDTEVAKALISRGRVGYLGGSAHLYVYVSHGANSWHEGHHRMLADTLAISQGLLRRREAQIREGLAVYDFRPGTITVKGNNGPAFIL